ncbi:MAG: ABC transporter permease [Dehalococcoidales bacterium]|nr:ABC transporter permease [Dehalococcoidales bacterium]
MNQKIRQALSILSIVLGTSLVAALVNLSLDIPQKASSQLQAYGANILILPQTSPTGDESYLLEEDLSPLKQGDLAQSITAYIPYLYSQVEIAGQKVVLAGTWLGSIPKVSPWWQVAGNWPTDGGNGQETETLVGVQVAEKLNLKIGDSFTVKYLDNQQTLKVAGIVTTGATEENQVFVNLKTAQQLTNVPNKVGLVQVNAKTSSGSLAQLATAIEQLIPGTEARVVGQIARAERQVLYKVQLLMGLVAGLIVIASGLVILSTMTTTILERTKEIGLMKALGASNRRIVSFYGAEIGIIALAGGVIGYLLGYLLAQLVGQRVFNAAVSPSMLAFLAALAVAVLVMFFSSSLPLYRAMKVDPALTLLREE